MLYAGCTLLEMWREGATVKEAMQATGLSQEEVQCMYKEWDEEKDALFRKEQEEFLVAIKEEE